jgi:HD-GYP domain-containing protein (c-di-GMP phosphodiesterase class II)/class 3 adenylate cyclase
MMNQDSQAQLEAQHQNKNSEVEPEIEILGKKEVFGSMGVFRDYIFRNFEGIFILLILISVSLINYLIYSKVAFLNFYFLPILTAGYFLGKKTAVLGAFFATLMIWVFVLVDKENYLVQTGEFDLYFNLIVWGGFLVLSAWWIGSLSERFRLELKNNKKLQNDLAVEKNLLKISNEELNKHTDNLAFQVSERTRELERSHRTIETLKTKVEDTLFSVMDGNVARMMIEGKLRTEKRRISVLFSDLKDFTSYSDTHPPEQVVDELNTYLNKMEKSIIKYFGHIDKYMGDGIMVEFGAPINYQMHSLMAVLAALNMQSCLKELNTNWQMRIGIATGPSVIGLFGSKRKSYSCIGDTANLASRLENICDPGGVFIDEETYFDVKPYVLATQVNNFSNQRSSDEALEKKVEKLQADLEKSPDDIDKLNALGKAYFEIKAASASIDCFQKVLGLDPNNTTAKLGFADANLKKEEFEKISIKGKKDRMSVYRVVGLVDNMLNRSKIPEAFYDKYNGIASKLNIPDEVILPVESIDGRMGHGKIVAIIACAMADVMKLSLEEKEDLLIAAFLHDIGNAIIPSELLDNNRQLTPTEYEIFKKHPTESCRLIQQMGYQSESLLEIVEGHHERWNGSGYPNGLKGEQIPLGARILAVADTFDAMTSKRLYAETWEYKSAIREIEKETKTGFYDPRCLEVLKELFEVQET